MARAEDQPGQPQQAAQSRDAHAAMRTAFEEEEWLFASVIQQVRRGELSRAAKKLVASPLAPGTQETLNKLADPRRRPTRLFRPLREEDLQYAPPDLMLNKQKFLENVRSAKRGSAPGRCGTRHEHYRVLLEDIRATDNLYFLAQKLAVGDVPESIRQGLAVAHLTALQKVNETGAPTGDVRGIATGIVLRRLVARTIAQQFSDAVLRATSPFQFALSTRAGVDCVALMTKLLTDMDDDTTVASLDGIGAYDHVSRACFLEELRENPELAPLLPFVRLWYSRPSTYTWRDEHNTVHNIPQAEGVEQGDPLSPLLFSSCSVWQFKLHSDTPTSRFGKESTYLHSWTTCTRSHRKTERQRWHEWLLRASMSMPASSRSWENFRSGAKGAGRNRRELTNF